MVNFPVNPTNNGFPNGVPIGPNRFTGWRNLPHALYDKNKEQIEELVQTLTPEDLRQFPADMDFNKYPSVAAQLQQFKEALKTRIANMPPVEQDKLPEKLKTFVGFQQTTPPGVVASPVVKKKPLDPKRLYALNQLKAKIDEGYNNSYKYSRGRGPVGYRFTGIDGVKMSEVQDLLAHMPPEYLQKIDWSTARFNGVDISQLNLRNLDLKGACFEGAIFKDANLEGVDFKGASLGGANLSGANFKGAHLQGADLSLTDFSGAKLAGCNLYDVSFRLAKMGTADLRGADFNGAIFDNTEFVGTSFNGAKLKGAEVRPYVNFNGAKFAGADLDGFNFGESWLAGADFNGAKLKGARITHGENADFTGADLAGANLSGAKLRGAKLAKASSLKGANLSFAKDIDFRNVNFNGVDLSGCIIAPVEADAMTGADFGGAKLEGTKFQGLSAGDWSKTSFVGADLKGAEFLGSFNINFKGAKLGGAKVGSAQFKGARFGGADLNGLDFDKANLDGASFDGAKMRGARLHEWHTSGIFPLNLHGADMAGFVGDGLDLTKVDFKNAVTIDMQISLAKMGERPRVEEAYTKTVMTGVNAAKTEFIDCEFTDKTCLDKMNIVRPDTTQPPETRFDKCTIADVTVKDADLRKSVTDTTVIENAVYDGTDFGGGTFKNTAIADTSFVDTKWAAAKLIDVVGVKNDFTRAKFTDTTFSKVVMPQSTFYKAKFVNVKGKLVDLTQLKAKESTWENCKFEGITLFDGDLTKATFIGGSLKKGNLAKIKAYDANFINVDLSLVDFTEAKLVKADLTDSNLAGSQLYKANLQGATLTRTKLQHSILQGADLTGAVFDEDKVGPESQFFGAVYDDETKFPGIDNSSPRAREEFARKYGLVHIKQLENISKAAEIGESFNQAQALFLTMVSGNKIVDNQGNEIEGAKFDKGFIVDRDGNKLIYANVAARVFGYDGKEIQGIHVANGKLLDGDGKVVVSPGAIAGKFVDADGKDITGARVVAGEVVDATGMVRTDARLVGRIFARGGQEIQNAKIVKGEIVNGDGGRAFEATMMYGQGWANRGFDSYKNVWGVDTGSDQIRLKFLQAQNKIAEVQRLAQAYPTPENLARYEDALKDVCGEKMYNQYKKMQDLRKKVEKGGPEGEKAKAEIKKITEGLADLVRRAGKGDKAAQKELKELTGMTLGQMQDEIEKYTKSQGRFSGYASMVVGLSAFMLCTMLAGPAGMAIAPLVAAAAECGFDYSNGRADGTATTDNELARKGMISVTAGYATLPIMGLGRYTGAGGAYLLTMIGGKPVARVMEKSFVVGTSHFISTQTTHAVCGASMATIQTLLHKRAEGKNWKEAYAEAKKSTGEGALMGLVLGNVLGARSYRRSAADYKVVQKGFVDAALTHRTALGRWGKPPSASPGPGAMPGGAPSGPKPGEAPPGAKPGEPPPSAKPGEAPPGPKPGEAPPGPKPGEAPPGPKPGEPPPGAKPGEAPPSAKPGEAPPNAKPGEAPPGPQPKPPEELVKTPGEAELLLLEAMGVKLRPNATLAEIQEAVNKAFRKIGKMYHPDRNVGDMVADSKYKLANGINDYFGKPGTRKADTLLNLLKDYQKVGYGKPLMEVPAPKPAAAPEPPGAGAKTKSEAPAEPPPGTNRQRVIDPEINRRLSMTTIKADKVQAMVEAELAKAGLPTGNVKVTFNPNATKPTTTYNPKTGEIKVELPSQVRSGSPGQRVKLQEVAHEIRHVKDYQRLNQLKAEAEKGVPGKQKEYDELYSSLKENERVAEAYGKAKDDVALLEAKINNPNTKAGEKAKLEAELKDAKAKLAVAEENYWYNPKEIEARIAEHSYLKEYYKAKSDEKLESKNKDGENDSYKRATDLETASRYHEERVEVETATLNLMQKRQSGEVSEIDIQTYVREMTALKVPRAEIARVINQARRPVEITEGNHLFASPNELVQIEVLTKTLDPAQKQAVMDVLNRPEYAEVRRQLRHNALTGEASPAGIFTEKLAADIGKALGMKYEGQVHVRGLGNVSYYSHPDHPGMFFLADQCAHKGLGWKGLTSQQLQKGLQDGVSTKADPSARVGTYSVDLGRKLSK